MSESKGLVLVVEDEKNISDIVGKYLRDEGFGVHVEHDGALGLAAARRLHPVAIVLDIGLPTMDGMQVLKELRGSGDKTPVIFLTARDDVYDPIVGLELGADDYITKPPRSFREVVSRVKAVLRRDQLRHDSSEPIVVGEVTLDPDTRKVSLKGEDVSLTATEFDLLAYLMSRPSRVFTRDELLSHVWGYASIVGTRTVDVHVAQLRAKFGDYSPIRTVRGVGYSVDKD